MTMNRVFVCPVIPLSEKSADEARTTKKSHDCTMLTELERQIWQSSLKSRLVIGFLSERGAWGLKSDACTQIVCLMMHHYNFMADKPQ